MKNNILFISLLFISISSCTDDFVNSIIDDSNSVKKETPSPSPLEVILDNIGCRSDDMVTRSSILQNIIPYVVDGDTALFIVNYPEGGYEIYSNSFYSSMRLGVSERGQCNLVDGSLPEPLSEMLEKLAESVLASKELGIQKGSPIDGTWSFSESFTNDDYSFNDNTLGNKKALLVPKDSPLLGQGQWVMIDSVLSVVDEDVVNHLLSTRWGQRYPYNLYIPLDSSRSSHCPVGCSSVALGMYMYYMHQAFGNFPSCPSRVVYYESTNRYEFSDFSETMWDQLSESFTTEYSSSIDSVALYLGYISNNISTRFTIDATYSSNYNIASFLNNELGFPAYCYIYPDYDYIITKIQGGEPVIIAITGSNNHCVIADAYCKRTQVKNCRLGWVGTDCNGNPTNEMKLDGSLSYSYITRQTFLSRSQDMVQIVWGLGDSWYDTLWLDLRSSWVLKDNLYYSAITSIVKR